MNDFMYGLAVVKVGEKKLGYIEENRTVRRAR